MQSKQPNDPNPKYCQLILTEDLFEGWTLTHEWGRQNGSRRLTKKHFPNHESAEDALMDIRDKQIENGFKVMFIQGDAIDGQRSLPMV
jgi:hypothetical protein